MIAPFDIGDKITFTVTGEIKRYSKSAKDDDCYTVYISEGDERHGEVAVYVSTQTLLLSNARRV